MSAPKSAGKDKGRDELLQDYAPGAWIFRSGDSGDSMFVIEEGEVELVKEFGGESRVLARLGPGDFFGEMAVLDGRPRSAAARAATRSRLLPVDGAAFDQLLRDYPEVAVRMLRMLAARLRRFEEEAARAEEVAAGVLARAAPASAPVETPTVEAAPSRPGGSPVQAAFLLHPETGRKLPLPPGGDAVVGRLDPVTQLAPEIDLTQLDTQRSTSRRHARIRWNSGQYWLREEAGTANGTFLEGQRLAPGVDYPLLSGQRLRFGRVDLVFRVGTE